MTASQCNLTSKQVRNCHASIRASCPAESHQHIHDLLDADGIHTFNLIHPFRNPAPINFVSAANTSPCFPSGKLGWGTILATSPADEVTDLVDGVADSAAVMAARRTPDGLLGEVAATAESVAGPAVGERLVGTTVVVGARKIACIAVATVKDQPVCLGGGEERDGVLTALGRGIDRRGVERGRLDRHVDLRRGGRGTAAVVGRGLRLRFIRRAAGSKDLV